MNRKILDSGNAINMFLIKLFESLKSSFEFKIKSFGAQKLGLPKIGKIGTKWFLEEEI